MPEGNIRIAEYFYIEERREMIAILANVEGGKQKVPRESFKDEADLPEGFTLIAEREITIRTVKWALINGAEVLEADGS